MLSSAQANKNYYTFITWKRFWNLQKSHFKTQRNVIFSEWLGTTLIPLKKGFPVKTEIGDLL